MKALWLLLFAKKKKETHLKSKFKKLPLLSVDWRLFDYPNSMSPISAQPPITIRTSCWRLAESQSSIVLISRLTSEMSQKMTVISEILLAL